MVVCVVVVDAPSPSESVSCSISVFSEKQKVYCNKVLQLFESITHTSSLSLFPRSGRGTSRGFFSTIGITMHRPSIILCLWEAAHSALTRQRTFIKFQHPSNLDGILSLCVWIFFFFLSFFFPQGEKKKRRKKNTQKTYSRIRSRGAVHKEPKSTCHIHSTKTPINLATNVLQNFFHFFPSYSVSSSLSNINERQLNAAMSKVRNVLFPLR